MPFWNNMYEHCRRMPSIGGYHPYGLASILTGLESNRACVHGRRIAARQPTLTCLPELRRALLDEWCNIPQDQIDNLILSMPRRYNVDLPPIYSNTKIVCFGELYHPLKVCPMIPESPCMVGRNTLANISSGVTTDNPYDGVMW
ncbi:uncharacterized protein TNCV_1338461 [Trichonephila clavipes]|nr:uncharacterized protein TNCV_1338461 [Trichonephila clavipes]